MVIIKIVVIYRPLAVETVVSKLFEQVIFVNIKNFVDTTDNQFGFKTKHNTDMCVFLLKQAISYYITRCSPIFYVFLLLQRHLIG